MRRFVLAILLLLPCVARAQRLWQEQENTNGYCTAAVVSANCAMVSGSDGTIACVPSPGAQTFVGFDGTTIAWRTIAASWIGSWPTGVLEGSGGALTTYPATLHRIPVGNSTSGLTDFAGLTYDGSALVSQNTTVDAGWFESDNASTFTRQLTLNNNTAGGSAGIRFLVNLTDVGDLFASASGTAWRVPSFSIQNTGGVTKLSVTSGGNIQIASLAGAGTQCVQADNTGTLSGTGSPCGAGGAGGGGGGTVAGVFGTAPIAVSPSTPNPTVSINLASDMTVVASNLTQADYPLVSRSTNAPANAVNMGALASGVNEQTTTLGVATPLTYQCVSGAIQFGAASGSGLAQDDPQFHWDDTNHYLGIGTNGPGFPVDVLFSGNVANGIHVKNSTNGTAAQVQSRVENSAGNLGYFGIGAPLYSGFAPVNGGQAYVGANGTDLSVFTQGATNVRFYTNATERSDLMSGGQWRYVAMAAPGTPPSGDLDCWGDSTAKDLTCKNDAGTVTHGVQSATSTTGVALTGVSDAGAWTTQNFQAPLVACTDYVSVGCQTGATDIGGTNGTTKVVAFENNGLFRGTFQMSEGAAPGTPSIGTLNCGAVLSDTNLECVNNSGTNKHLTQNIACGAHTWASSSNAAGLTTCTQPAFSDLSGSVTCAQLPALTGDTTSAGGTCATTTVAVEDGANAKGYVDFSQRTAPGTPPSGHTYLYSLTSSGDLLASTDPSGTTRYMAKDVTCSSHQWVEQNLAGTFSCTQPAFSDLSGSEACSQTPAFTGDATKAAGSCATTIPDLYKVKTDSGDSSPDYLANKVESTSGNISITTVGSPKKENFNVVPSSVFTVPLVYTFQWLSVLNVGELVSGGITPNPTGSISTTITEYPMGLAAGTVKVSCYLIANRITSGTYTFKVAKNGVDTGAALSYTSLSTPGMTSSTATVGSPSTADTWGLDASSVGTATGCGSGLCPMDVTCTVLLQP